MHRCINGRYTWYVESFSRLVCFAFLVSIFIFSCFDFDMYLNARYLRDSLIHFYIYVGLRLFEFFFCLFVFFFFPGGAWDLRLVVVVF